MELISALSALSLVLLLILIFCVLRYERTLNEYRNCPPNCSHELETHLFIRGLYRQPDEYDFSDKSLVISGTFIRSDREVVVLRTKCGKTWRENVHKVDDNRMIILSPEESAVAKILEN